jgi:glycerol kinase
MAANDGFCQRLADLSGCEVLRPIMTETTALGAAYLAALGSGLLRDLDEIRTMWTAERSFRSALRSETRDELHDGWKDAVARVRSDRF